MDEDLPRVVEKNHSENILNRAAKIEQEDNRHNKQSQTKCIGQFMLGEKLGEGTFGTVRLATHIETKEQVAIKILEKLKIMQLEDKTRVEREIKILKCLRHNNITQLYSVIQTNENICLVIEYVSGKELFDYIIENKHLSELESCHFYQQIISGIEYLHKLRVVHRDLKPENLLIDQKNTIKIVDFGLSIDYGDDEMLSTACGSPCYAAPEMLVGKKYKSTGVDIWSSGIVLYAMLSGYLPFDDTDNDALYKKITQGRFEMPDNISDAAKDLIKRIMTTDPQNRISIYQIKRHPWFNITNPKLTISLGLLMNQYVIPIDEDLVEKMGLNGYNKEEVRSNVLSNRHNQITTTYYLLLRKMIKENKASIADLKSSKFLYYIGDKKNLFSNFNHDFKNVVAARATLPDYANTNIQTEAPVTETKHKRYMSMTVSSVNKDRKLEKDDAPANILPLRSHSIQSKNEQQQKSICNDRVINKITHEVIKEAKEESYNKKGFVIKGYIDKDEKNRQARNKKGRHKVSYSLDSNYYAKNRNSSRKYNPHLCIKANAHLATTANSNDEKDLLSTPNSIAHKRHLLINKCKKQSILGISGIIETLPNQTEHFKPKYRNFINTIYTQSNNCPFTPFDLSCISFKPLSEIKEKVMKTLQNRKIKYRTIKNKFICDTSHMKFSLEILKKCDIVNAYIIQLKRIEGSQIAYQSVTTNLIEKIFL